MLTCTFPCARDISSSCALGIPNYEIVALSFGLVDSKRVNRGLALVLTSLRQRGNAMTSRLYDLRLREVFQVALMGYIEIAIFSLLEFRMSLNSRGFRLWSNYSCPASVLLQSCMQTLDLVVSTFAAVL